MSFKSLASAITSKASRQLLKVQKHSPTILFVAGTVGVVATVVLASRATLKLEEVLDEAKEDFDRREEAKQVEGYTERDYANDGLIIYTQTALKVARLYGPAILVGAASIAALTGSHYILRERNLGLMAAYAALDRTFKEYRRRVADELGEEKENEFRYCLADQEDAENPGTLVKIPSGAPSQFAVCFDESNRNYKTEWSYNLMFLQCQQQWANDLLRSRGHVFLNEVYDMLGFPRTKMGAIMGWVLTKDHPAYIDFGVLEGDRQSGMRFIMGHERAVWLNFEPEVIWDKI